MNVDFKPYTQISIPTLGRVMRHKIKTPFPMVTTNLVIRAILIEDYEAISRFFYDDQSVEFLSETFITEARQDGMIERYIQKWIMEYFRGDFLEVILGIEEKKSQKFVGFLGIENRPQDPYPQLALNIMKEFRGKGYGPEAGICITGFLFKEYNVKRICGLIHPRHVSSQRAYEKIGMVVEGTHYDDEHKEYMMLYVIKNPSTNQSK